MRGRERERDRSHFGSRTMAPLGVKCTPGGLAVQSSVPIDCARGELFLSKLKVSVQSHVRCPVRNRRFVFFCSDKCRDICRKPKLEPAALAYFLLLRDARTEVSRVRAHRNLSRFETFLLLAHGRLSKDIPAESQELIGRALYIADENGAKLPNWIWILDPAVKYVRDFSPYLLSRVRSDEDSSRLLLSAFLMMATFNLKALQALWKFELITTKWETEEVFKARLAAALPVCNAELWATTTWRGGTNLAPVARLSMLCVLHRTVRGRPAEGLRARLIAEGLSTRVWEEWSRAGDGRAIKWGSCPDFREEVGMSPECSLGLGSFKAYVARKLFGEVVPFLH